MSETLNAAEFMYRFLGLQVLVVRDGEVMVKILAAPIACTKGRAGGPGSPGMSAFRVSCV